MPQSWPWALPRALALLVAGVGIEIGRLIVARPDPGPDIDDLIRLVRRGLTPLDVAAAH